MNGQGKAFVILTLTLGALCLSGCARFNTFYNARQYYEQAEAAYVKSQGKPLSAADMQLYDKAIQKASKVLTFHPNSSLVDDALLLMGKSFYRKGEYPKAIRKFSEVIANFPESELAEEAAFWRGMGYFAARDDARAEQSLSEVVRSKKAKKWAAEAQFLMAEMAFQDERYEYAIEEYGRIVEEFSGTPRQAEAQYRIGQCLMLQNRLYTAQTAFRQVLNMDPPDSLQRNATFSIGQILREEGRYDQAIDIFGNLLKDSQNIDYYSAIRLELAACEVEKGDMETGLSTYEQIIKDYPKSESSAEAHYHLGNIHMNLLGDLRKAKEHFAAVKTENAKSTFVTEAQRIEKNIDSLVKLYEQIFPPPDTVAISAAEDTEKKEKTDDSKEEAGGTGDKDNLDEVLADIAGREGSRPAQSAGPDSTRDSTAAGGAGGPADTTGSQKAGSGQKSEPVRKAPVDTAAIHFQLAELFLLQFANVDSALRHYSIVADRFPLSKDGARASFAAAWIIHMVQNDPWAAQEAYAQVVANYPATPYGMAAWRELGGVLPEGLDTTRAEALYLEAERLFSQGGDVDAILTAYQRVLDQYPDSPYAPKARYAIGWIHEYIRLERDGAEQIYRTLLDTHSNTDYGKEAKLKLGLVQKAEAEKTTTRKQEQKTTEEQQPSQAELTLEAILDELQGENLLSVNEPELSGSGK